MHGMQGVSGSNPLGSTSGKNQLTTGFLAACKSRFFNAEKAKYHFLCAKSLVSRMAAAVSSGISCELTLPSRGCFLSRLHGHI